MFDELNKYKNNNHFFFGRKQRLDEVCNAPTDKSGVYLVYALKSGKIELVYIGSSGKIEKGGSMFIPEAGLGGLKDTIVNGHQFGKFARRISWPAQMEMENIEALDIYWYATQDNSSMDGPGAVETQLLKKHLQLFRRLPKWNQGI